MVRNALVKISLACALAFGLSSGAAWAQDAKAVIAKAQKAMGPLKSLRYSGTGKLGAVAMGWNTTSPWHATDLVKYTRTIDYPSGSSRVVLTYAQTNPTDLGGQAPFTGERTVGPTVSGNYAWTQPSDTNPPSDKVTPTPGDVEMRQMEIVLTPQGFLNAAAANGATAKDDTKDGHKQTALTFMWRKYKIKGDIDSRGLVTKIETKVAEPVMGDMALQVFFTDYKRYGAMMFPSHILQTQGGLRTFELNVSAAEANVPDAALTVPPQVLAAKVKPDEVTTLKMADGVWIFYGGHNSVLVEFKDYLALIEAPVDEERSITLLAAIKKLGLNKPLKYVINTHHHSDHSGGLRTFVAEGATIITHETNKAYFEWAWKQPRTLEPDELSKHPKAANFITFNKKYTLTDGDQTIDLHWDFGDMHDQYLVFAYLPKQRIIVEADDFSAWYATPLSLAMWNNLYGNLARLKIDPLIMAPLHGPISPMDEWVKVLRDETAKLGAD
ncbi:MAG TPA: MBL fold metallo-hydrolase [Caulobacteraceae bacterium]|nr:MBL fold metallo-hydrolase [Caulobacteraceae bacterium]